MPVVANQDGVGYPGWAGDRTEEVNRPLRRVLRASTHVIYQSAFSKLSSDLFLGEPTGSWEILPNAVDVDLFAPATSRPSAGPVLILGGDQTQEYRLEVALRTMTVVVERHPDAQLLVTGRLVAPVEPLLDSLGLRGRVLLLGEYTQRTAPHVLQRGHLLLHTKVKDPCPTLVLEAMASGLPVVYPASGGTVELVGDDAGIGVPHPESWERDEPPGPEALADAVDRVLADLDRFSAACARAGRRAVRARAVARPSRRAVRAPRSGVAADPPGERDRVEPRPVRIELDEGDDDTAHGPDEHPTEHARRVPVLSQEVADACPLAAAPGDERPGRSSRSARARP